MNRRPCRFRYVKKIDRIFDFLSDERKNIAHDTRVLLTSFPDKTESCPDIYPLDFLAIYCLRIVQVARADLSLPAQKFTFPPILGGDGVDFLSRRAHVTAQRAAPSWPRLAFRDRANRGGAHLRACPAAFRNVP